MLRRNRILKRLAIGLAISFALLLVLNGSYRRYMGGQLEMRLAKLRAAGEPTVLAELAPEAVPTEHDAAVQLERLASQLTAFAKEQVDFLEKSPTGKAFREREQRGEPPTSEQIAAIQEIVSHYPNLPTQLNAASRCQGYASQLDYSVDDSRVIKAMMLYPDSHRSFYRFLRWDITVLLAEGKQPEALEMGLVILRLARHFNREPGLVQGGIAIAVRSAAVDSLNVVLRTGPIPTELRRQLDQELVSQDDPEWIQHVIKTEQVISLSAARGMHARARWMPWMESGLEVDLLDFYQRLLPVVSQPWHTSRDNIRRLSTNVRYNARHSRALIELLQPSIEAFINSYHRNAAMLRCLRILNGLTEFAQTHGHEAEKLDDLNLPGAAQLDPFSGQPLKLKWTDKGWVVYTVFANGMDDNGDFQEQADWGLAPLGYAP